MNKFEFLNLLDKLPNDIIKYIYKIYSNNHKKKIKYILKKDYYANFFYQII